MSFNPSQYKVAHMTSAHSDRDIRIFLKECTSLAAAGYEVSLIIPNVESRLENGVMVRSFSEDCSSKLSRMVRCVNRVYEEAVKVDADIYHIHDPELLRVAGKLKAIGKKVVYDTHEDLPRQMLTKRYIPMFLRRPMAAFMEMYENSVCRKLDGIIAATPFIRDRFLKINSRTVDINNFPLMSEIQFTGNEHILKKQMCYIGGVGEGRGLKGMIEAAGILEIPFHVGGKWPDAFKKEMKKLKGWEYVVELGFISREQSDNLKSESTVGMLTFKNEPNHINAQPNKMFEYMAAGLPVIASNFPLWEDIIENNRSGICVDPENPSAIAEAIKFFLDNPHEAKNMGNNGRNMVQNKYNWETEKSRLLNFYQLLLS